MNRPTLGLLAALCLTSACKEEPVGAMTPIPRPADMPATPEKKAEAPKPAAAEPPPDPSKVTLRWKLDAPTAFRLTTTSSSAAPAPAPAPKSKKGKKDKESQPAASPSGETDAIFVLQKTESGDYAFRIVPQKAGGEADQGAMSERGFVMDGLAGPLRNVAVLVLELPRDPVGPESTWALGTDLVDMGAVQGFVEKKAERRNQVKLTALTPGENGEQVATLEYDLSESLAGEMRATRAQIRAVMKAAGSKPGHAPHEGHEDGDEDESSAGEPSVVAEMRVKGRGEFLVKAGRWRSWEATLTTRAQGTSLPGTSNGERTLRLTPLDPVPPELLQPQAKK